MKTLRIILMAGLLAGALSQAKAAASQDPNDKPVEGAEVVADGTGCTACKKATYQKRLTDSEGPNTTYDNQLNDSGSASGAADKAEKGSH